MKKSLVSALAVSLTGAVAAVAVAQTYQIPGATFEASVTPANAGTKKKPKNSKIRLSLSIPKEARLTTDQLIFHLPRHVRVSGRGFRFCPSTTLETTRNPNECPRGSKVGSGTASAALGQNLQNVDFNLTIFAGSRNELGIWLQSTSMPFQVALRGVISRAGSPYYQKLTIDLPDELQRRLDAYVHLTGLNATLGATRTARVKGKRRRFKLITTTGCPNDRRHRFETRMRFVPNPNKPAPGEVVKTATSSCRR